MTPEDIIAQEIQNTRRPVGRGDFISRLIQSAAQGLSVGLSQDPGAALGRQLQGIEDQRINRQNRIDRLSEALVSSKLRTAEGQQESQRRIAEEEARQKTAATYQKEKDKRDQEADMQKLLGQQTFAAYMKDIDNSQASREKEEERKFQETKQKTALEQGQKQFIGKQSSEYIKLGASPESARRIARYEAGMSEELTDEDRKTLRLVQARIDKSNRQGGGGGSGQAGLKKIFNLAELDDGSVIEMDQIKSEFGSFTNLPEGRKIKRVFAIDPRTGQTITSASPGQQGTQTGGGGMVQNQTAEPQLDATGLPVTFDADVKSIRGQFDDWQIVEETKKLYSGNILESALRRLKKLGIDPNATKPASLRPKPSALGSPSPQKPTEQQIDKKKRAEEGKKTSKTKYQPLGE